MMGVELIDNFIAKEGMDMNILLLAGSNRQDASSTKLLRYMERRVQARGYAATLFDLRETPVPFYSADEEIAHPNVRRLLASVGEADGIVIATPEYHGSVSGVLKNALDYLHADVAGGKPVLSVSASGGPVGVSSLTQLQGIVRNLHGINCPEWISIGGDQQRFEADGSPANAQTRTRVERALESFVALTRALSAVPAR